MNYLIIIAIIVRVITNLTSIDWVYFAGRDIFEIIVIYILYKWFRNEHIKSALMLSMGCAIWNLFKPLFADVTKLDPYEIGGFFIGLIIIFAQYVKKPNT